jgi:hypothetical protein
MGRVFTVGAAPAEGKAGRRHRIKPLSQTEVPHLLHRHYQTNRLTSLAGAGRLPRLRAPATPPGPRHAFRAPHASGATPRLRAPATPSGPPTPPGPRHASGATPRLRAPATPPGPRHASGPPPPPPTFPAFAAARAVNSDSLAHSTSFSTLVPRRAASAAKLAHLAESHHRRAEREADQPDDRGAESYATVGLAPSPASLRYPPAPQCASSSTSRGRSSPRPGFP